MRKLTLSLLAGAAMLASAGLAQAEVASPDILAAANFQLMSTHEMSQTTGTFAISTADATANAMGQLGVATNTTTTTSANSSSTQSVATSHSSSASAAF